MTIDDLKYLRETPNAIIVEHPDSNDELAIPFSQVEDSNFASCNGGQSREGDYGYVDIPAWLAKKEGLL